MTTFDRQAVIESLSRLVTPGIKFIALADELGARKHEYDKLRTIIDALVADGVAQQLPGGAFKLAPSGRPGDRKATARVAPEREEYDPPDEPFANEAPTRPTRPLKTFAKKKEGKTSALPWGKGGKAPPKPPRVQASKGIYRGEYDPETGEIVTPGTLGLATTASTPNHAAPVRVPPERDDRIKGRITVHPAGYGFVAIEGGETVFVPAKYRNTSLEPKVASPRSCHADGHASPAF
jgi:hypothetical protein